MRHALLALTVLLSVDFCGADTALAEEQPSTGLVPLTDMSAADIYKGEDGGLYGHGRNVPPEAHFQAALRAARAIVPRDAEGHPVEDGQIVVISNGMSNTTQEFSRFVKLAEDDLAVSDRINIVDCAQGGKEASRWANSSRESLEDPKNPWNVMQRRLLDAGATAPQVQVAWIKQARAMPARLGEFPQHVRAMRSDLVVVIQELKKQFPNLQLVYLSNRIYAGYASTALNPEPYAYESAFANRWLIQDQMKGAAELNFDPARGAVKAPVLLWGPYLWADGEKGRRVDELIWKREDLAGDGTHPSNLGRQKVASLLLGFFKTDRTSRGWFVNTDSEHADAPGQHAGTKFASFNRKIVEPPVADWDEPLAKRFSLTKAAEYLDAAALAWTRERKCATCHTNVAYLMARPALAKLDPPTGEVREAFELWSDEWDQRVPSNAKIPALAVTLASTLAINDSLTTGELHPATRRAFDRMWKLQRQDGGWDWRVNNAPPMKSDEHYGATFAAVAVGLAPSGYASTPEAMRGIAGIRRYLASHAPHSLHHQAMVAWASLGIEGLMGAGEREEVIEQLFDLQQKDGGWSAPSLFGDWKGWDLSEDELYSDGYGTGFVIYLARQVGIPAEDARIQRGVTWIQSNQRESGRWFTASIGPENPYGDNRIATAGTAMVVLALDACGKIP